MEAWVSLWKGLLLLTALLPVCHLSFIPSSPITLDIMATRTAAARLRPPLGISRVALRGAPGGGWRQNMGKKARDMNVAELKEELRERHGIQCEEGEKRADLVAKLQQFRDPRSRREATSPEQPRRGRGKGSDGAAVKSWTRFCDYYKQQLACLGAEQVDEMLEALLRPLPVTFRVSEVRRVGGSGQDQGCQERRAEVLNKVEGLLQPQGAESRTGLAQTLLKTLDWYPNNAAWQLDLSPMTMRQAEYRRLQQWLVGEAEAGRIWRQEAVSMVPVLMLQVEPGMMVLDMCAAPGSKTSQLLEGVTSHSKALDGPQSSQGAVVANDADIARAQMMVHRCKALRSPNLIVTNYQGQAFPKLRMPRTIKQNLGQGDEWQDVSFDAVLCDVPCSGDGTLRKYVATQGQVAPKMRWHPDRGNRMHMIQLGILERGIHLVKVGGMVAYSTCSLNPIENEAVVAALLEEHGDALELVESNDVLQGLKTMFPPKHDSRIPLSRCLRILPHSQDTGGFFVALFKKKSDIKTLRYCNYAASKGNDVQDDKDSSEEPGEGHGDDVQEGAEEAEGDQTGYYGVREVEGGREVLQSIRDFYQLTDGFPEERLLARSLRMSQIRYVSGEVACLVRALDSGGEKLKVSTAGILAFQNKRWEQDTVRHRLCMEGLSAMLPMMGDKRIIRVTADLYLELLTNRDLPLECVPGASALDMGTFVCSLDSPARNEGRDPWAFVCWRGGHKVLVFADKQETLSLIKAYKDKPWGGGGDVEVEGQGR